MNKPFLLIAGCWHYPEPGTGDWKQCYASIEECYSLIEEVDEHEDAEGKYYIDKECYDWYTIVDLREWTQ